MGSRGPVPKRSEERRRRNKPEHPVTSAPGAQSVSIPEPCKDWHPIARQLWDSLAVSGQARFYEPSDWAVAYSLMDDISFYKTSRKRSGQMLTAIMSGLSTLLLTEGERRRVGIELSRPATEEQLASPGVEEMEKWRKKLGEGGSRRASGR